MRPVSYIYKGKTRTHFGVIADEIYDLLETDKYSIWSKLKDEQQTQTIQTQEFIGIFIKAIQELHGTVKHQSSKIEELERKQMDLMRNNNELERTQMKTIKRILRLEEKLLPTLSIIYYHKFGK
jgi:flagellar biosynthesis chaperone FliJ